VSTFELKEQIEQLFSINPIFAVNPVIYLSNI